MKSTREVILNNGNKGKEPRPGRKRGEYNKRTRLIKIIGQENYDEICRKQADAALYSENDEQRLSCQRFIMSLGEPKPAPIPHETYVEDIPLLPMASVENIKNNSDLILNKICKGDISMEIGERFFNLIEQARKNWEATEMKRMLDETNQRITRMEEEKGIEH